MRVLLLANAAASSVTARTRVLIQTLLNDRYDVQLAPTQRRGHAARLASEAADSGIDCVVVLGGDGTLNEVANGLAGTKCAMAALPGGSTNVFARTIGTDDDPLVATTAICDALDEGRTEVVGLGAVQDVGSGGAGSGDMGTGKGSSKDAAAVTRPSNTANTDRLFLFHCGIGFDAAVVRRVEKWPKLKRYLAHPLYIASAATALARGEHRSSAMSISTSATPEKSTQASTASYFTVVLNTDPYTYLGSRALSIAPAAKLTNGLSVVALRSTSARSAMNALQGALSKSDGVGQLDDSVIYRADDLSEVRIRAGGAAVNGAAVNGAEIDGAAAAASGAGTTAPAKQFGYQIDGEYLGKAACLRITHRPRILPVVIP